LLDEATSALDPIAATEFFRSIKLDLPKTAVLSVHHSETPPVGPDGIPLFDTRLEIANGMVRRRPVDARLDGATET
jgi:ABC-type uncharacterized transport system fused permease/ATPase subunit